MALDLAVRRSAEEASCGAAIRVKPKVRLCEPWVVVSYILRAAERRQRIKVVLITRARCRPFRGSITLDGSYPRLARPRLGLNSERCSAAWCVHAAIERSRLMAFSQRHHSPPFALFNSFSNSSICSRRLLARFRASARFVVITSWGSSDRNASARSRMASIISAHFRL